MESCKLLKHRVVKASFYENRDREKKDNLEVGVDGNIFIPKKQDLKKTVMVRLRFHLGKEDERIWLILETLSFFEIDEASIDDDTIRQECLSTSLKELRNSVKMVTEAYGMPPLSLPPFDGEVQNYKSDF